MAFLLATHSAFKACLAGLQHQDEVLALLTKQRAELWDSFLRDLDRVLEDEAKDFMDKFQFIPRLRREPAFSPKRPNIILDGVVDPTTDLMWRLSTSNGWFFHREGSTDGNVEFGVLPLPKGPDVLPYLTGRLRGAGLVLVIPRYKVHAKPKSGTFFSQDLNEKWVGGIEATQLLYGHSENE